MKKLVCVFLALVAVFLIPTGASAGIAVDLELVLAADVSGSVDGADFVLQRDGYVNAFNDAALQNAIMNGVLGKIAVTMVYWSDGQSQVVPWTIIDSAAT